MTHHDKTGWDYAASIGELEDIISRLQQPDLQIDDAITLHTRGKQLVDELKAFLAETKATVTKLSSTDAAKKQ